MTDWSTAGLWMAVLGSGLYHGLNPGMGWPLAVSAGLMGRSRRDLVAALASLAGGHFVAMAGILLPFAALAALATWQNEIRLGAGLLVVCAGAYLLFNRRHPKVLARIKPTSLALWSLAAATAHGAGLMLVPVYLGLCRGQGGSPVHPAADGLIAGNLITAFDVAAVHAGAMIVAGGAAAFAVYEWLGVRFIARSWFNVDALWPLSLLLVGAIDLASLALSR
jgi:hypothetical protein